MNIHLVHDLHDSLYILQISGNAFTMRDIVSRLTTERSSPPTAVTILQSRVSMYSIESTLITLAYSIAWTSSGFTSSSSWCFETPWRTRALLYVAVSASHVTLSCDCGKFSVVYSSIDHINATELSSPILSCNRPGDKDWCWLTCPSSSSRHGWLLR